MLFRINNVLPSYFEVNRKENSEVWGKDLSFTKGELVKIVAPSGSGKTSLIHFLYGMRKEYSGSITYNSKELNAYTIEETAALRAGPFSIVFQDLRLFLRQTVLENLEVKRQLNPYHNADKISEMAGRLGIDNKLRSVCGNCSYGEQQRIAIIRSLLQPFEFLLLDEPFSHLDNANAEKAMALLLEEAKARNACILFADLERSDIYPYTRILHL
ncbi:MAG: ATP-binding cassette domain-containing protein [Chitinophagaceae bacterium]|nr:ATP-binding cassette domain-containing protein [Chitinophagaceae bacterium]